jgi:hypothetical protein
MKRILLFSADSKKGLFNVFRETERVIISYNSNKPEKKQNNDKRYLF